MNAVFEPRESGLARLRLALEAEGGLLAVALVEEIESPVFDGLAIVAPCSSAAPVAYAEALEGVLEGYLLHYRSSRLLRSKDRDLCLLAGDFCYSHGLERLTSIGDRRAVGELANLIASVVAIEVDEVGHRAVCELWRGAVVAVLCGDGAGGDGLIEQRKATERALDGALGSSSAL